MPLSKPVKKQQLLLPSQKDFLKLPTEKKQNILQRLSVDNLITYLEYIVSGYHQQNQNQSKNGYISLEQIVENDSKYDAECPRDNNLVLNWISKHSNLNAEMDNSLLNIPTIANTERNIADDVQPLVSFDTKVYCDSNSHVDFAKQVPSNDSNNLSFSNTVPNQADFNVPKQSMEVYYQSKTSNSTNINHNSNVNQRRAKIAWENILQSTRQGTRWQNSFIGDKENNSLLNQTNESRHVTAPSANINPVTSAMDLSLASASINQNNAAVGSYYGKSVYHKQSNNQYSPSIAHFTQNNFEEKSSHSQLNSKVNPLYFMDINAGSSFSDANFSTQSKPDFGNSLVKNSFGNSLFNSNEYKRPIGVDKLGAIFDPLSMKNTGQTPQSTLKPELFSKNPEMLMSKTTDNNLSSINNISTFNKNSIGSINLDLKDSKVFDSFNLPSPSVFNEMTYENRVKVLQNLPNNVKNKYELFCWSSQINQFNVDRRLGGDLK